MIAAIENDQGPVYMYQDKAEAVKYRDALNAEGCAAKVLKRTIRLGSGTVTIWFVIP